MVSMFAFGADVRGFESRRIIMCFLFVHFKKERVRVNGKVRKGRVKKN